ncbi:hypothetical protein MA16_Dca013548 [Dendrobium catenatum]|uniref:Uncharacterized protein n=1 Tax=Dendrobium catenatum TaxID=906689 RepID=A0A2I0VPT6_9ASPA|nr:hypothetical protein MA16_Dca013548 [Dendrobium catenatum]
MSTPQRIQEFTDASVRPHLASERTGRRRRRTANAKEKHRNQSCWRSKALSSKVQAIG